MASTKLISNIKHIQADQYITISTENSEPRKFLTTKIKELREQHPHEIILIAASFVGRRALMSSLKNPSDLLTHEHEISKLIAQLVDGKRVRTYYAIMQRNVVHIIFEWVKIKHLSNQEIEFIEKNWHENFFNTTGRHLVKQFGGSPVENLIYRIIGNSI